MVIVHTRPATYKTMRMQPYYYRYSSILRVATGTLVPSLQQHFLPPSYIRTV